MARTKPRIWPEFDADLVNELETVTLGQVREALASPLGREHSIIRKLRGAPVVIGIDPGRGGQETFRDQQKGDQQKGEGSADNVHRSYGLVMHVHLNLQSREDVAFFTNLLSELHRDRDVPEGQA